MGTWNAFFGNVGMVYSRVAARNKVLEPSFPLNIERPNVNQN